MRLNSLDLEMLSDKDLMIRVQKADHEAFAVLVNRHSKMFYGAAYRMCPCANEAEDIVQEAFLKLWARPQIWDANKGAKFTTWFYRVVTNLAIDNIRKKKNTKGSDSLDSIMDKTPGQDEALEEAQKQLILEAAMEELPERQKVALNLCFYEELSNKDAAQVMDVNVKALESLLMRAKRGLKDVLMRQGVLIDTGKIENQDCNETEKGRHYGA
ncbi:MAG: sigma-70 family RNA polymerase sigma factor [Alphaproteobacteria bacterium]|nr:sigma-70 family RNA polymerase sigma factor [Alphaproteobacteria bacterium]